MKAAAANILLLIFCLAGAHNYAHASASYAKLRFSATHNTLHQQQIEASSFIDVEDENDDKCITRKLTHQAKWTAEAACALIAEKPVNQSPGYLLLRWSNHPGPDICIEQRVLRI
jgi:hypothetical protein